MSAPDPLLCTLDLRAPGPDQARWRARCGRSAGLDEQTEASARAIVSAVRGGGDQALLDATARLEGRRLSVAELEVPPAARAAALAALEPGLRGALEQAATAIRRFHETQRQPDTGLSLADAILRSRVRPLGRVAVYAPGGTAAYPSSVLMAAIPAKVAGVAEVVLLTPRPSPVVLAAAALAGVDRLFQVGGAQAIAAAAYGTETIPRVDKIVGPGNAWVTAAKRLVFGVVAIDGIAGPSEILIAADHTADPELVAADLLSQAEHDPQACAILVTDAPALPGQVAAELAEQLASLPRRGIAEQALRAHGAAVLVTDRAQLVEAIEAYAPEHLELLVTDARALAGQIRHAGAIFVGPHTPEAAGDYTAGPSHVLPTAGAARFMSPLGVWDFVKHTSELELSATALLAQAPAIVALARAEGLEAHARAVLLRVDKLARAPGPEGLPLEGLVDEELPR